MFRFSPYAFFSFLQQLWFHIIAYSHKNKRITRNQIAPTS